MILALLPLAAAAAAGRPHLMVNPCLDGGKPFHALPFCNHSLPTEARA